MVPIKRSSVSAVMEASLKNIEYGRPAGARNPVKVVNVLESDLR